jgi:hypothetical protein
MGEGVSTAQSGGFATARWSFNKGCDPDSEGSGFRVQEREIAMKLIFLNPET